MGLLQPRSTQGHGETRLKPAQPVGTCSQPATQQTLSFPPSSLHLISGGLSGLASCVVLQPFDLLKTRVQQLHLNPSSGTRLSVFGATSDVIIKDGVAGLWRGTTPTILRNVPGVALYLFGLAELRKNMSKLEAFSRPTALPLHSHSVRQPATVLPTLRPAGDILAGVIARSAVGFILMPITVVKTRFESNLYSYPSITAGFKDIVQTQGIVGLWRGFLPTVLRDAPFAGIFVSTYEAAKKFVLSQQPPSPSLGSKEHGLLITPVLVYAAPAAFASAVATLVTAPFDLIKTQLQLQGSDPHVGHLHLQADGAPLRSCILQVLSSNRSPQDRYSVTGLKVFFNGSGLRLVRKGLSSAIGWTIYEALIKKWATKD